MSDRVKGFIVTLEDPMRDDDAEHIANAIAMIRGVGGVKAGIDSGADVMNREMERRRIMRRLVDAVMVEEG